MDFYKLALSLFCCTLAAAENPELVGIFSKKQTVQKQKNEPKEAAPAPKFSGHCPSFPIGGDAALAFDYFRSLPDGSWAGNTGAYASLNSAAAISKENYGFGAQLGGSYGLYDWDSRGSNTTGNTKALQQQAFITLGLFRRTPFSSGFNAGLVYDAMFNKEFGVFALNPILGQVRAQLGYLIQWGNEVGIWGALDTQTAHKETSEIPVKYRAISQFNLFWTHYFKNLAQASVWVGTPYRRGLMYNSGRAGTYIVGASFRAPLTRTLSIVGHGAYMGARSGSAFKESSNYGANATFGINYSFGGCKAGQRPYLPLADNSNFLVDANLND